jgi:hypothetical protein
MKEEKTISKINSELIRTFAALDAWFDKALDDGFEECDQWNTLDVIQHIVTSNDHLLDVLTDGYEYAFSEFDHSNRSEAQKSFDEMRLALREQLFQCLCLLDELEHNGSDEDETKEMNAYDKLSSLTNHLHYHLERLENSERVNL